MILAKRSQREKSKERGWWRVTHSWLRKPWKSFLIVVTLFILPNKMLVRSWNEILKHTIKNRGGLLSSQRKQASYVQTCLQGKWSFWCQLGGYSGCGDSNLQSTSSVTLTTFTTGPIENILPHSLFAFVTVLPSCCKFDSMNLLHEVVSPNPKNSPPLFSLPCFSLLFSKCFISNVLSPLWENAMKTAMVWGITKSWGQIRPLPLL